MYLKLEEHYFIRNMSLDALSPELQINRLNERGHSTPGTSKPNNLHMNTNNTESNIMKTYLISLSITASSYGHLAKTKMNHLNRTKGVEIVQNSPTA